MVLRAGVCGRRPGRVIVAGGCDRYQPSSVHEPATVDVDRRSGDERGATHGRHTELYRAAVTLGLGCDSSNWANSFDIGRAAVTAILVARDGRRDRSILTAEDGFTMATIEGATAIYHGVDEAATGVSAGWGIAPRDGGRTSSSGGIRA